MSWLLRVRDLKSKLRILIWNPHLHVCKFSVHTCVFSYLNHNSKFINFSAAELRGFWFSQQSAFFKMDGSLGTWDLYVAFGIFSWCFLLLHELADNGRCELQTIWTFSVVSLNHCSFFPGFHRGLWLSLIVPHPLTWWEVLQREMFVPPVMRCDHSHLLSRHHTHLICCLQCLCQVWEAVLSKGLCSSTAAPWLGLLKEVRTEPVGQSSEPPRTPLLGWHPETLRAQSCGPSLVCDEPHGILFREPHVV